MKPFPSWLYKQNIGMEEWLGFHLTRFYPSMKPVLREFTGSAGYWCMFHHYPGTSFHNLDGWLTRDLYFVRKVQTNGAIEWNRGNSWWTHVCCFEGCNCRLRKGIKTWDEESRQFFVLPFKILERLCYRVQKGSGFSSESRLCCLPSLSQFPTSISIILSYSLCL